MTADRTTKVAFFSPIFAHYRRALLNELLSSERFTYELFADSTDKTDNIPTLDLSTHRGFSRTSLIRLPGGLIWQTRLLVTAVLGNFDAYILPGDAKFLTTWIGAAFVRLRGRRVLFWTHGWNRVDPPLKRWLRNAFYRLSNGLLIYGERAQRLGQAWGFDASKLHVMYNSLDFQEQRSLLNAVLPADTNRLKKQLFGSSDRAIVIASARLTGRKRFDILIEAISCLQSTNFDVCALIIGDGADRTRLAALAEPLGESVRFVGECYDEPLLAQYFACATVLVSPGDVGLTAIHSMSYGVPVITHGDLDDQMPEHEIIVEGVTGSFFQKGSAEDLARRISEWVHSTRSREDIRDKCIDAVRRRYNAAAQCRVIEGAIAGDGIRAASQRRGNA